MSVLITGVAGFIGTNLAKKFVEQKIRVVGIDNYSRGREENLADLFENEYFDFYDFDLTDLNLYKSSIRNAFSKEAVTEVWHFAANSDIPAGIENAQVDLADTFMTTFNTLEVMKELELKKLMFASSSAVYGDLGDSAIEENIGPLFPISNYGAMKLASEAIISAAVESYIDFAYIFRFPNVIGTPATHGVILDFIQKLKETPSILNVLGDGTQQKSYLHVSDLIDAMFTICERSKLPLNYFNVGAFDDGGVSVREIAQLVVNEVSPEAIIKFGKGSKGWIGDVPKFSYSVDKIRSMGWSPKLDSRGAMSIAIKQIAYEERGKKY
jgi:UDP-glucose 4-epimerase